MRAARLWEHSAVQSQPHLPSLEWDWVCLRSQSTLRTGLNDVPAVRCTVGGTSSAVHTSTAARVPLDSSTHRPARLRWRCTKRPVLLAHSLTLAADLCIIVPGSVGEVPALVCMHYQCTRQLMYTKHRRQFRQKNRILQTKRKKIDTAHS